jgi:RNA polymerase sigma factor (sigma-70 family)
MTSESRFQEVFDLAYPIVARYTRRQGLAGQDLEDCVAATFEVAWRRRDRLPSGDEAVPWLLAVARNHARNHRRGVDRDRRLLERLPAPEPTPGPEAASVGWVEIRRALAELSDADQELLLLVAWDGLTPTQAAGALGIRPGAGRTRLHRARDRLSNALSAIAQTDDNAVVAAAQRSQSNSGDQQHAR